ncbi:unnamed protein product [Schistosoma turkestanicum]|nr:unnamed protein product [Schistosoma turkestanicum]
MNMDLCGEINQHNDNHSNGYEIYSEMMQSSEISTNPPAISLNCTTWDFTSNSILLSKAITCAEQQLNKTINQDLELNLEHLAIQNTLIVQNFTNSVLIIHWTPTKQIDVNNQVIVENNKNKKSVSNFRIEPTLKELAPNSSTEFTIMFTPVSHEYSIVNSVFWFLLI